ncbi:MAG: recombination mediator RecR [Candidatus Marinimicrobia bacterium]|nr:recombination mediator RecR [Candidatus Neomarinimicrobiota bacterium]MCF7828073.1 recombination mediator RecR [Candidatus Neomarinimicrobiota bacterium]MCF7879752.1 recombination mediator RecR [Candidatus Neomarinimicrobiota bacterium]
MQGIPESLQQLIDEFKKFPGVGRKTAQRLAFHILKVNREDAASLANAILATKDNIKYCSQCYNISEADPCEICEDPKRDRSVLCVVEDAMDVIAIEKTSEYRGLYHVLGGLLSPLDGVGPDDLNIQGIENRLDEVEEVILATNPSVEGETTAHYLTKLLKSNDVNVSRLARGIPVGSDVEYIDEATLARALEGRVTV